jgi:hypothetical protein
MPDCFQASAHCVVMIPYIRWLYYEPTSKAGGNQPFPSVESHSANNSEGIRKILELGSWPVRAAILSFHSHTGMTASSFLTAFE